MKRGGGGSKEQASPQSLPRLASPEYCTWTTDLQLSVSLWKVKFCKNEVLYLTDLSNTHNTGKTKRVQRRSSQGYKLRVISIKFLLLISMPQASQNRVVKRIKDMITQDEFV